MAYQTTFKRYEIKYFLNKNEKEYIKEIMKPYMKLDAYGRTTIRNIYFDTENYRLIRRSIEKPVYKEKLRVRSYSQVEPNDPVFVELKKKYKSVVYKRRLTLPEAQVMQSFENSAKLPCDSQIADEIEYFRSYYKTLRPSVFLTYERKAYYSLDASDFRVTFDENILYRNYDFSLGSEVYGTPLLDEGNTLMEIKTSAAFPLWMSEALNDKKIYRTSFSKYGSAYKNMTADKEQREIMRRKIYA